LQGVVKRSAEPDYHPSETVLPLLHT
jgi:hypothetical protein